MALHGVVTALITPFSVEDGSIDTQGLRVNVAEQLAAGVDGLISLGSTGEDPTIPIAERAQALKVVIEEAKGKLPILVGVSDNSTLRSVDKALQAKECGADILLLCMPYYNRPSQEGLVRHIESVAAAGRLPVVLYNHPGRTGVCLQADTILRLAKNPQIIGVKDCTGDLSLVAEILAQAPKHFFVMTGDDDRVLPMMSIGASGVMSVISNLVPAKVVQMVSAFASGRVVEARYLYFQLYPLMRASCIETNPIPIKTAMGLCGKAAGPFRLPLCELQPQNLTYLEKVLDQMRLLTPLSADLSCPSL